MAKLRIDPLDDSPCLIDTAVHLLSQAFSDPDRYSINRITQELTRQDATYYRQFFVAMQSGELLGIGGIKAADWASHTHLLYLSAVAPEWRGRGIGQALVEARIRWLEEKFEHGRILVSTRKTRRFSELGFREIRRSCIEGRRLMIRHF